MKQREEKRKAAWQGKAELACRIASVRRAHGLSQETLAWLCGFATGDIVACEEGEYSSCAGLSSLETTLCIAEAMPCDAGELYELVHAGGFVLTAPSGNVACNLASVRQSRGLSQKNLSAACRERGYVITNKAIQKLEHGTADPALFAALALARTLDCQVGDLFERKLKGGVKRVGEPMNLTNRRFGKLTVIGRAVGEDKALSRHGRPLWVCECDCGRISIVETYDLRRGLTKSCGSKECAARALDLTGMKFGRLTAIERSAPTNADKHGEAFWLCECECGGQAIVRSNHLTSGHSRSCGCLVPDGLLQNAQVRI